MRISKWIEDNIDLLTKDKNMTYVQKMRYREMLTNLAEKTIAQRRFKMHHKKYMKLKIKMSPEANASYQVKNDYVENKIEKVFNYYKNS